MVFATVARGHNVEVTANRSDEEPGRIIRLERVLGFVQGLASHYGNIQLLDKVVSVHDHKGDLTVCWSVNPTGGEMELFNRAWNDPIVGDAWGPIEHIDSAERLIQRSHGRSFEYRGLSNG